VRMKPLSVSISLLLYGLFGPATAAESPVVQNNGIINNYYANGLTSCASSPCQPAELSQSRQSMTAAATPPPPAVNLWYYYNTGGNNCGSANNGGGCTLPTNPNDNQPTLGALEDAANSYDNANDLPSFPPNSTITIWKRGRRNYSFQIHNSSVPS
jgi:hypothetical protein